MLGRYSGLLVYIHTQFGNGERHRRVTQRHSGTVVLGLLRLLVDAIGRTGFGEEYIAAVQERIVRTVVDIVEDVIRKVFP